MNEANLRPVRTESEARELGRRGGIASGEARRERRQLREMLELVMEQDHYQLDGTKTTKGMAMCLTMVDRAIDGDVGAFRAIRDLVEPVTQRLQVERPSAEAYAEVAALLGIDSEEDGD